jgi:hypothetical protein
MTRTNAERKLKLNSPIYKGAEEKYRQKLIEHKVCSPVQKDDICMLTSSLIGWLDHGIGCRRLDSIWQSFRRCCHAISLVEDCRDQQDDKGTLGSDIQGTPA